MNKKLQSLWVLALAVLIAVGTVNLGNIVSATVPGVNEIISKTSTGGNANGHSGNPIISANGKIVVFTSSATNILPTGGAGLFVKDIKTGVIQRANVSTAGVIADNSVTPQKVSANGRYILMTSAATNLIDGSVASIFPSSHLYLRDTKLSTTTLISQTTSGVAANKGSGALGISSDGRFISFVSNATNLHPDASDGLTHLYILDRQANTLTVHDRKLDGSLGASYVGISGDMSCDGSLIVFNYGNNLLNPPGNNYVNMYLLDRRGGSDRIINLTLNKNDGAAGPTISCNGDYIGFSSPGTDYDTSISTLVKGWYRPYIYDRINDTFHYAVNVPINNNHICTNMILSSCIKVSNDGIAVMSLKNAPPIANATNLQVYVHNVHNNNTELISKNNIGVIANDTSYGLSITEDGRVVVYDSGATNLVSNDTNGWSDIFKAETGY